MVVLSIGGDLWDIDIQVSFINAQKNYLANENVRMLPNCCGESASPSFCKRRIQRAAKYKMTCHDSKSSSNHHRWDDNDTL